MLDLGRRFCARDQLQNKAPGLRYGTWNFDRAVNLDPNNPGVFKDTAGCRDYMLESSAVESTVKFSWALAQNLRPLTASYSERYFDKHYNAAIG